jgi:hypothetical protein
MRIVETLAKQYSNTTLRTILSAMHSVMAHEAAIGRKEQIRVGTGQARQCVEGYTVNGHED